MAARLIIALIAVFLFGCAKVKTCTLQLFPSGIESTTGQCPQNQVVTGVRQANGNLICSTTLVECPAE